MQRWNKYYQTVNDGVAHSKNPRKFACSVSRDLWSWPWPWAQPGCRLTRRPSCASLVAIRPFACEKKRFSCPHKSARITWLLTLTLTLSTIWMHADLETMLWKFGGDPAICLGEEAICAKVYRQTDRQTHGRRAIALAHSWNELIKMKDEIKMNWKSF